MNYCCNIAKIFKKLVLKLTSFLGRHCELILFISLTSIRDEFFFKN